MKRTEPFRDLAAVDAELARLDLERKLHRQRLERHWHAIQDHEVRGHLLRDAANDAIRSWKPLKMVSSMVGSGSVMSALGTAVRTDGSLGKRALRFGAALLLPMLVERASGLSVERIGHELSRSADRIKKYIRERKERLSEEHPHDD